MDPVEGSGPRIRRRLPGVAVAGLVALAAIGASALLGRGDVGLVHVGLGDAPHAAVLPVPSVEEQVAPAFLDDGSPVFVVNLGDEGVAVLDARVPRELEDGVDVLVMWCPSAASFQEHVSGSEFGAGGRHLVGPAPAGLAPYDVELLDGGRVRVGDRLRPPAKGAGGPAGEGVRRGQDCGSFGPPERQGRWHHAEQVGEAPGPRDALADTRDGHVVVSGTLEFLGTRPPVLCGHTGLDRRDHPQRQCEDDRSVPTALSAFPSDDPDLLRGYQGVLVLEVREGRVTHVTATSGAVDYHGAFRGEDTLRGILLPADARPELIGVLGAVDHARDPDLHVQVEGSEPVGLWLTDEVEVVGRAALAGELQWAAVERLLAAAEAGETVRVVVTFRRGDRVIVRIEEEP